METTKEYISNELSKAQDILLKNPESNAAREIVSRLINDLQQNSKGE